MKNYKGETAMANLKDVYEAMQEAVSEDSKLSDEEKFQIMFGKPYTYKDPWKGVIEKPAG